MGSSFLKPDGDALYCNKAGIPLGLFPIPPSSDGNTNGPARRYGFALHVSALTAKEMQGTIMVTSEGLHKSATFSLNIPLQIRGLNLG